MTILQLAARGIRASLGRLALTMTAIVAGVGFVAGSFILADSLDDTFDALLDASTTGFDAVVMPTEPEFGSNVQPVPDTVVDAVEALPEVGGATPFVAPDPGEMGLQPFVILDDDGDPILPPFGGYIYTSSWQGGSDGDLGSLTLVEGTPPKGLEQVAIDTGYARAAGVAIGDRVGFATPDGPRELQVVATVEPPAGQYAVAFDFASAQVLFHRDGEVDAIGLTRAPGVTTAEMVTAVEGNVPTAATVLSLEELIDEASVELEKIVGLVRSALLGFAGIALFVSLFIIYNTFAILVTQRLHQIGMLRAIGATQGQIRTGVLIEAAIVGLLGSIVGLALGYGLASALVAFFEWQSNFDVATVVSPPTIAASLAVGIGATVLSALLPALLAGRVTPIAAMRNEAPGRSSARRRTATGSIVSAVGLVLLTLGLFGDGQATGTQLVELSAGVVLTFVGVALLSTLFAGPVVDVIGRAPVLGALLVGLGLTLPVLTFTVGDSPNPLTLGPKLVVAAVAVVTGASVLGSWARGGRPVGPGGSAAGLAGRLARQNASRAPKRTAATATALTIAIALASTVGVVGESMKTSAVATLDRAIQADLMIYDTANQMPFTGELADRLDHLDGVAAVSRFRFNEIRIGDEVDGLVAYEADTGRELIDFAVTDGSTDGLVDGGVLVHADTAEARALAVGDTVAVEFPDLVTEQLVVVGVFTDNPLEKDWVVDLGLYERHITSDDDDRVAVSFATDVDRATVEAGVLAVTDEFPLVSAQDTAAFVEAEEDSIELIILIVNALLGLALFIAFLGVVNTIVLSVIERTREVGLLRAVGMTRRQIRATIRWEAVVVCLFGAILGIVLGVLFAWAAVSAIPDDTIASVTIPYESISFAVLSAALAGVVAAVVPARRAAELDVLDAIAVGG